MTFRERLQEEWPACVNPDYFGGCLNCPCAYNYESIHSGLCGKDQCKVYTEAELRELCTRCWDRESPDVKCKYCGGTLSEVRMHNGRRLQHCYSCHFEFYLD